MVFPARHVGGGMECDWRLDNVDVGKQRVYETDQTLRAG